MRVIPRLRLTVSISVGPLLGICQVKTRMPVFHSLGAKPIIVRLSPTYHHVMVQRELIPSGRLAHPLAAADHPLLRGYCAQVFRSKIRFKVFARANSRSIHCSSASSSFRCFRCFRFLGCSVALAPTSATYSSPGSSSLRRIRRLGLLGRSSSC